MTAPGTGNMTPSTLDRLPKGVSAHWEAERERFDAASEVPDEAVTVAVSLDGVMVAMKDAQRAHTRAFAVRLSRGELCDARCSIKAPEVDVALH